ncbi:MAG: hypothetical protein R3240_11055 [Gammaproteobacteria bacterium]|nr:hypothetical protein [Gammaproteobacteria bacterium]
MHAGFPCFTQDLQKVFRLGGQNTHIPQALDLVSGRLLAGGMAMLLKIGFGYLMRDSLLDEERSRKSQAFFDENFVFSDSSAPDGKSYYQGKFLIRTARPGDDMNVYFQFCPRPDELYVETVFGRSLNSLAVITTDVLTESEADAVENDPDKVDLVIRFRDLESILNLVGKEEVDIVGLLLENVVQLTGNTGHLFKLGAIATDIELELGLTQ